MENKKEKNNKKDLIVKIVLVIIIILLLLHNCVMIKKSKKEEPKTPTGNVDIFEITCEQNACINPETNDNNKNNNSNVPKKDNDNNINNNNNNNNENNDKNDQNATPSEDDEKPTADDDGDFSVQDNNIVWKSKSKLRIFENPIYENNEIIAPESTNVYQFIIKNTTEYDLKYRINFIEDNNFNINMKYKVKRNNTYIIDEYVSASELQVAEYQLNSGKNDTYYLEWKWVSSSNDTAVGNNPSSNYKLSIEINAESF